MKKFLVIFIILSSSQIVLGQEVKSISVQVIHSDEPPTNHGPQMFEITFTSDEQNNLIANYYTDKYKRRKKVKLQKPILIQAQQVDKFNNWITLSKSDFLLTELGVDISELGSANSPFKTEFEIKEEKIRIDSFNTCTDWQFKRSFSTGGYSIKVYLVKNDSSTEILNYSSNDIGAYKFDIQSFLITQPLIQNKIPEAFGTRGFFERQSLIEILNYYYKVIECEGYYYNQFIEQDSERTKKENRMMIGWNFKEYMNGRNKK